MGEAPVDATRVPEGGSEVELRLFTPLLTLEQEMQSMFDRVFGRSSEAVALRPVVDVIETGTGLEVQFELPGVEAEDVEINVDEDTLIVKGSKRREREVDEEHRYLLERCYGAFERRIPLPDGVDTDAVTAAFDRGVLTVEIPVKAVEHAEMKKVPIATG